VERAGLLKEHRRRGRIKEMIFMQTISKQMAGMAKEPTRAGDRPLPEVWQVVDHRTHLLGQ
jgi:hypothetical protein